MSTPVSNEPAMKRTTVWAVERHSLFFGDAETVREFDTKREAEKFAKECRRASKSCDDPEDRIVHVVTSSVWEWEA